MADVRQLDTIGTAEVADILGWSRAKVKREAKNGGLPTIGKLPAATGAYLFNRSTIEYFARRQAVA
jgi:hypothetical protein